MTEDEPRSGDVVRRDRFSGGPARSFLSSMAEDERIFEADLAVDRAHVVMLAERDVIADEEAGAILGALDEVADAGYDALPAGEDVHEAIESAVIDLIGATGGRMHTARSRNDEVATCIRYRLREDLLETIGAIAACRESLLDVADGTVGTVMPGYTHLQPAQPTTVAHWLWSYEGALARDAARLLDAYDRVNRSPLGAAAFGGTPFDIDRHRTAELLGFDGVIENAMDAASARDFLVETLGGLASAATTLSGIAEDVIVFANRGYVELSDDYASTSSIMPQKKNPDTLELTRATAGDAAGGLSALVTTLKGLPRAYNRDLQRATPHVWRTIDAVREATTVAAGAIATASWNEASLAVAAGEGFSTATGVADLLAMNGMPFRTAHEVVARAAETGADVPAVERAVEAILDEPLESYVAREALEAALDPAESVGMRDSYGGPAPSSVRAGLARARESLEADREATDDRRNALDEAATRRLTEVKRYA